MPHCPCLCWRTFLLSIFILILQTGLFGEMSVPITAHPYTAGTKGLLGLPAWATFASNSVVFPLFSHSWWSITIGHSYWSFPCFIAGKSSSLQKARRRSTVGVRGSPETNCLIRFIAQQRSLKNATRSPLAHNSPLQVHFLPSAQGFCEGPVSLYSRALLCPSLFGSGG